MRESQEVDRRLSEAFREAFALEAGQEDALWARFQQRQRESVQWAAFAAAMVLINARMRPIRRAALWWCQPHW